MESKITIKDNLSQTCLFETDISNYELAQQKALEFEEMGLDISIHAPGLATTLMQSLGASLDDIENFSLELDAEIEDHDGDLSSCAICLPEKK